MYQRDSLLLFSCIQSPIPPSQLCHFQIRRKENRHYIQPNKPQNPTSPFISQQMIRMRIGQPWHKGCQGINLFEFPVINNDGIKLIVINVNNFFYLVVIGRYSMEMKSEPCQDGGNSKSTPSCYQKRFQEKIFISSHQQSHPKCQNQSQKLKVCLLRYVSPLKCIHEMLNYLIEYHYSRLNHEI